MRIFNNSLRQQIVLLLVLLVLLTTIAIQVTSWWSARNFNNQQINQQIQNAINILTEYSQAREELLITAARVLTADFGFKNAVATADEETLKSMLQNHGERINADLMMLTNLEGELIADSSELGAPTQFLNQLQISLQSTPNRAQLAVVNGKLYQLILQPVLAPRAIAYTLIGFEMDQQILEKLTNLTMMDLSFMSADQVLLTSLDMMASQDASIDALAEHSSDWFIWSRPAFINTELRPLTPQYDPVTVILTADLRPIYKEYDNLALKIIAVASFIMLCAVLSGLFFAGRIARPISRLVGVAQRFSRGDYQQDIQIGKSSSEIKSLSNALETMGQDIQTRENQITFQAEHDGLTGLLNAPKLRNTLENALPEMGKSLQIAFYIDNFRQINDQLGPEFADTCLQIIAQRLNNISYPYQQFHGRMDGIEFISVLQLDDSQRPNQLTDKILEHLERPLTHKDIELQLRFYCGITLYPEHGDDQQTILRRTRIAADHARSHRKRLHCYEPGQDEARLEQLSMIEALNAALKLQSNELYLHFQPKVNIENHTVTAVETLIRWQRPGSGHVRPDIFIDLAEQAGLIVSLTRWVVSQAMRQLKRWHHAGLPLQAAINVSAEDICHPMFCQMMEQTSTLAGIEPRFCIIEITERDIMYDEAVGLLTLKSLKKMGFRIALDDYGIGQSTLVKLKDLPIDELKLDKAFIMTLDQSDKNQKIVRATINMAHSLGMKVVAEGVENAASLQLLKEMACDAVQGYHVAKPMRAAQLETWLENNDAAYRLPALAANNK
ncbi:MAG TPA: EAL domain-containing protein [Methylophaga sp.]|nr:EAL domain-containing protein [Methylophaga sp.]